MAGNDQGGSKRGFRTIVVTLAGLIVIAAVAYILDWVTSSGKIPRGVTVAAVSIGGLTPEQAEARLRREIEPRIDEPFTVVGGDVQVDLLPSESGLNLDWDATVDRAGSQPINPLTRLMALFREREIGYVSAVNDPQLDAALDDVREEIDREAVEGDIEFDGATPVAVEPLDGLVVEPERAREVIIENWLAREPVELPVEVDEVTVTPEGVESAMREIAEPAVATSLVVIGEDDTEAVLEPEEVGDFLSFQPDQDGGLEPLYDVNAASTILSPQLADTESPAVDATVRVGSEGPVVVPHQDGRGVDWDETFTDIDNLMRETSNRTVTATYRTTDAQFTTEEAEELGINEVIAEFTTGGFTPNSGVNIRRAAEQVNGAVIKPGETFSLNDHTGPRGYAQGYIDSGIIYSGRPSTAVGGGVSQFATTLYNAGYFAGLDDIEHTEHSYYISRYPAGREATVFEGSIDLQFQNPYDTGVLLEAYGDMSSVTVRVWGTKTVNVESINGGRWDYTQPRRIVLPAGPNCQPSSGGQGFTTSDTRVITDANTNEEISRETRTVTYEAQPVVVCEQPTPPPARERDSDDDDDDNGAPSAPRDDPAPEPPPAGNGDEPPAEPEGE
ncbi:VanW family protein [Hoyosella subflava]|uniref:VanW family protein n=1 Tax=Hoyosella subflava (strain DSM 45089 / JCM 17490 / NBRC 109087 / DQS3-9A1) TaxID=443218 RepID=F6EJC8_HOYSD|nr:VanW family protein [Hoyosella subflava]AEF42544.1 VanW family protein [Hoyosella subflava DQS3-9A1]